ncbi:hypothetical protein Tco_0809326 [Tanacetum coccineum]
MSEPHSDPSPRPSPYFYITDSIPEDSVFDELGDDVIDNMETEDAQGIGRTRYVVHEEKEKKEMEVRMDDQLGHPTRKKILVRQTWCVRLLSSKKDSNDKE